MSEVNVAVWRDGDETDAYLRYSVPEDFAMAEAYQAIMSVPRANVVTYGDVFACFIKCSDGIIYHGQDTEGGMKWTKEIF